MDLTTKARVQAILASGGQNPTPLDALIPVFIVDVSARFADYLGRALELTTRTERFDADPRTSRLFLEAYPISSVARIEYDPERVFGSSGEVLVENSDFVADSPNGIVFFEGVSLGFYRQAIEVEYDGGLGASQVAIEAAFPSLVHAADLQVAYLCQRRQNLGGTGSAAGGASASYVAPYELLPEVKSILDLLRRRGF